MSSLDDWHRKVARIYGGRNLQAPPEEVFTHLQEQIGALSFIATGKVKRGVSHMRMMPRAIGWWLALCGKMRIASVSDLLWLKFPGTCPYCLLTPHSAEACLSAKRESSAPRWDRLFEIGIASLSRKPSTIVDWQQMFSSIYPSGDNESEGVIFARLSEEMGELAEAIRVANAAPQYFVSEAADVFAWLMKVQNMLDYRAGPTVRTGDQISDWIQTAYGLGCQDCGQMICVCPPMSEQSMGRIGEPLPERIYKLFETSYVSAHELEQLIVREPLRITVAGTSFEMTPEIIERMEATMRDALRVIEVLRTSDAAAALMLQDIQQQLMWLSDGQRMNAAQFEILAEAIAGLEPNLRGRLLAIFEASTVGLFTNGLSEAVRALIDGAVG